MTQKEVKDRYFEWLSDYVCEKSPSTHLSYDKLLTHLHDIEFRYSIPKDQNRAEDGIDLRYRFALVLGYEDHTEAITDILDGPCSVLEMMVALAIRCEEGIMDDPSIGDRTSQWFWGMITNLGLGGMTDVRFDRDAVDSTIGRFLDRDYEPDGKGGLFTVRSCECDMRDIEIWWQLCYFLDSIT